MAMFDVFEVGDTVKVNLGGNSSMGPIYDMYRCEYTGHIRYRIITTTGIPGPYDDGSWTGFYMVHA